MNMGDTLTFQLCGSGECLVAGCTDPTASKYNSSAVTDDSYPNSLTFDFMIGISLLHLMLPMNRW